MLTSPRLKLYAAVNDKGRRIGQGHPRAKLLDSDIDLLFELRGQGWSTRELAEKFEIHKRTVAKILSGERRCQTPAAYRAIE